MAELGLGKLAIRFASPASMEACISGVDGNYAFWPLSLIILRRKANWAQGKIALWLVIGYLSYAPFSYLVGILPNKMVLRRPIFFFAALIAVAWAVSPVESF